MGCEGKRWVEDNECDVLQRRKKGHGGLLCVPEVSGASLCPLEKIMRQGGHGQVSVQAGLLMCSVKSLRALLRVSVTERMLQTQW